MSQVLVTEQYLDDIADAIRSKNGSESTYTPAQMAGAIEDINTAGEVVLVQKTVNANGQYNASDDSADGYSSVTVNVSSGGGSSDASISFDFTKGLLYSNVVYGSTGAIFDGQNDYIALSMPKENNFTIEIDVAMMQLTSSAHRRFVMPTYNNGFIYRNTGKWGFYNGSWDESNITDGSYFDNSTVGIYIDANNKWHIYRNGVLVYEPTIALELSKNPNVLNIGSVDGNSINNARITGVRVYIGNHYS